jgi:hypothetical protein
MAWIELEEAREMLRMWIDAEKSVSTGQSYKIGSRSLTRVDLSEIVAQQNRWRNEVEKLESGRTGARVMRAVPVDL